MPLSDTALLTNTKDEPSLGAELQAEIASADRVDLLVRFVKWHGMRLLSEQLDDLKASGQAPPRHHHDVHGWHRAPRRRRAGPPLRRRGEDQVTRSSRPGCTPRRGCSAATAGSTPATSEAPTSRSPRWSTAWSGTSASPRSRPRPSSGSSRPPSTPTGTDPDFRPYDPDRDADLLDRALGAQAGGGRQRSGALGPRGPAAAAPGTHPRSPRGRADRARSSPQPRRRRDRHRQDGRRRPRLPPARRQRRSPCCSSRTARRLLEQARRTYREVLGDGTFGELLVGGQRPTGGSTSSLRCSRSRDGRPCRRSTSPSSTSSITPRRRRTARLLEHLGPTNSSV